MFALRYSILQNYKAGAAALGVSKDMLQKMTGLPKQMKSLRDKSTFVPGIPTLHKLSLVLGCTTADLLMTEVDASMYETPAEIELDSLSIKSSATQIAFHLREKGFTGRALVRGTIVGTLWSSRASGILAAKDTLRLPPITSSEHGTRIRL